LRKKPRSGEIILIRYQQSGVEAACACGPWGAGFSDSSARLAVEKSPGHRGTVTGAKSIAGFSDSSARLAVEKSPGHRGAVTGAKSILSLARGLDAGAVYFGA